MASEQPERSTIISIPDSTTVTVPESVLPKAVLEHSGGPDSSGLEQRIEAEEVPIT